MVKHWAALTVFVAISVVTPANSQDRGETLFNQTCVACHTIGGGRLVGPDLAGVHTRREEGWLLEFIKSVQGMADRDDEVTKSLIREFNGIIMPDQALSDADVRAVLGYIALKSGGATGFSNEPAPTVNVEDLLPGNVQLGRDLFVGRTRFDNGGAACISCHNLNTRDVMTGGSLAKDLTDSVSRLTRQGVDAMIASPPFAPMRVAFEGRSVSESERAAIVDYLQYLESNPDSTAARDFRTTFLLFALMGIIVLLGFFFLLGLRGAKRSVNHAIYDRQRKSI